MTTDRDTIVAAYDEQFAALTALCQEMTDDDFAQPSVLPGWRVTDVLAHCLGTEYMLLGEEPAVSEVGEAEHVRNEIARRNEQWVATMRDDSPEQMRDRLEDLRRRRTEIMHAQTQQDFDAESWTPLGAGTLGDFMRIRVYDLWLHELDIRDSIGRPGHEGGLAGDLAIAEVERAIGYMIGKRAAAPDGSRVLIELTGAIPRRYGVVVEAGRAKQVEPPSDPTVTVRMSSTDFARLTGNRGDTEAVAQRVEVGGDEALGNRIARSLGYTM